MTKIIELLPRKKALLMNTKYSQFAWGTSATEHLSAFLLGCPASVSDDAKCEMMNLVLCMFMVPKIQPDNSTASSRHFSQKSMAPLK